MKNLIVVEDGAGAGTVTWWGLVPTDAGAMAKAWADMALPLRWAPPQPSPSHALRRLIVATVGGGRCWSQRSLGAGSGVAIFAETRIGTGVDAALARVEAARIWLDADNALATKALSDAGAALVGEIRARWDVVRHELTVAELSRWLTGLATGYASGVALRRRGGFYYVPPAHAMAWDEVVDVVAASGGSEVHQIPAVTIHGAAAAIAAALQDEVTRTCDAIQDGLDDLKGSNPGAVARSLARRKRQAADMGAKLGSYAAILGDTVTRLQDAVTDAHAAAATAELALMRTADAA